MTDTFEWRGRVGEAWAEEWQRTDRSLAPVQQVLLDTLLPLLPADAAILDIGCGAGGTSLALAEARPDARITGLDLSEALIEVARERARGKAAFEIGDASRWRPAAGTFDALVSRHGVMFFESPVVAFAHLCGLAAPGAPFVFSCFRAREENEWATSLAPILRRFAPEQALPPPAPAPGPFAFADPELIRAILEGAGFVEPRIVPLDCDYLAGEGADPVGDSVAYFRRIGPFAALLRELDPSSRDEALAMVAQIAEAHLDGDRVVFRAAVWIVSCASA